MGRFSNIDIDVRNMARNSDDYMRLIMEPADRILEMIENFRREVESEDREIRNDAPRD